MNYLQLVNAVLAMLRERQVGTVNENAYSTLIAELVNQAKEDVENACDWNGLAQTINITTTPTIFSYAMTDAGQRFRIIDVFNQTAQTRMHYVPTSKMNDWFMLGDNEPGSPYFYNFNGVDTNLDTFVDLWPVPNVSEELYFNLIIPQDRFTSDSEIIKVPSRPVILNAYWRAVVERGEDGGTAAQEAQRNYLTSLGDHVAIDQGHFPEESLWIAT